MKTCNSCSVTKPFSEYNRSKKILDGFRGECRACGKEVNRLAHLADPLAQSRRRDKRLEAEAGRARPTLCEICNGPPLNGKKICFDHDHTTGKFRGWLCQKCNLTLGTVSDTPELLRKLAVYIEQHKETK